MTADPVDLATTQQFIDYRPVEVTIRRPVVTISPAGGRVRGAPITVGTWTVRPVEGSAVGGHAGSERLTSDGALAVPTHRVTAMPDCEVQRFDEFDWDGKTWEVLWVSRMPEWRVEMQVIGRG